MEKFTSILCLFVCYYCTRYSIVLLYTVLCIPSSFLIKIRKFISYKKFIWKILCQTGRHIRMSSATSASSDVKEMFTSEIAEVTDGGAEDDEFVLTEAHVVAIRMIFKQFDTDGSGTIEPVELSKLCAALGDPLNKRELKEAFDHLDMNDNGKIGFEEFINFWRES